MKASRLVLLALALFIVTFAAVFGAISLYNRWKDQSKPLVLWESSPGTIPVVESGQPIPDFADAAEKILPSMVSIETLVEGENWFGDRFVEKGGSGSGVIISKDGYILTNNHVIAYGGRVAARVIVALPDGTSEEAEIVGRDPRSDLAVLKVEKDGLTPAQFGDSEKLRPGEWVIAAGSPLGFENTISVGVVSSLNRPLRSESSAIFVDGIQTDAAINKGNSGGALCDASGRLIGINTAIATTDEGSIGIGFSIPINRARVVVADIVKLGYVRYGETGIELHHVSGILAIPRARQELMRIVGTTDQPPKSGALIDRIDPGSAAQEAGLHQLDVITKINGKAIDQNADFLVAVSNKKPGDHLELTIWSRGEIKTVTLTLKGTHQNGQ